MARAATTLDAFAALAEPRRRRILEVLGGRQSLVTDLVVNLGCPQPTVSKHLAVLRAVGLVRSERRGRQVLYAVDPHGLRTVHDWTRTFEHLWSRQLERIKAKAEAKGRPSPAANSKGKERAP